jgi:hypothetical protein
VEEGLIVSVGGTGRRLFDMQLLTCEVYDNKKVRRCSLFSSHACCHRAARLPPAQSAFQRPSREARYTYYCHLAYSLCSSLADCSAAERRRASQSRATTTFVPPWFSFTPRADARKRSLQRAFHGKRRFKLYGIGYIYVCVRSCSSVIYDYWPL